MNSSVLITDACFLLEYLIMFILACGFLHDCWKNYLVRFLCLSIPFSFLATFAETAVSVQTGTVFIDLMLLYLLIWGVFRRSHLQTCLLSIVIFCTCMSIQLLLVLFFSLTNTSCPTAYQPIVANFITLGICLPIALFCKIHYLFDLLLSRSHLLLIGILNLSSVFLLINIYNKMFHASLASLILTFLFPLFLLFGINSILFMEYVKEQRRQKEKEAYGNYLPLITEMLDQVRIRQHKFDNELQAIRLLPTTYHDYPSLCDAINSYSGFIVSEYQDAYLLKLNMKCLAAFLYKKIHDAKQQRKHIELIIKNTFLSSIVPEYELINMAGILVDNMIEAICETDEAKLIIDSKDNRISITSINPGPLLTPALRKSFFEKGYSTKGGSAERGYGLYLLQQSVTEYGGRIYLDNMEQDGVCCVYMEIRV